MTSHVLFRRTFVSAELLLELSVPLLAGVLTALMWANLAPSSYQSILHTQLLPGGFDLQFLVNDVFMALFFGIAAKEITEACLPGGALNPMRKAISPLLATAGGVLGPIAVYFAIVALRGDWAIARGWGVPTATDIALAWLVARMAFGKKHPAVSFLLLLAVADDAVGLAIIAVFYPDPSNPVRPSLLLLVAAAVLLGYWLRRSRVISVWPYLAGPGLLSWVGLEAAHLHPALALVPIVPLMPNLGRDRGLYVDCDQSPAHDTLGRFEHLFKRPVDIGLFGFGLANAGVTLGSVGSATWTVLAALLVGKTAGITLFALAGTRMGVPLPDGMDRRSLVLAALTASLGLTVALFVAGVAFVDPAVQGSAKMGALLSVVAAPAVLLGSALLGVRRRSAEATATGHVGSTGAAVPTG